MTYIKLENDMRLCVTVREAIYRGDNLSKSITFLIPSAVSEMDILSSTVFLSYIRSDGQADMVMLERSATMYNQNYYQYNLPVTCKLSRFPGEVIMWLQLCSGNPCCPTITKSGECKIYIQASKSMDNCMSDHQLMAVYQIKKQLDSIIENESDDGHWTDMSDDTSDEDSAEYWENM